MSQSVFPYPGGKTYLANWVLEHFPDHRCYVEPFAGSASVLLAKRRSKVEVVNDRDGDITHFYLTLRDHGDELREWLEATPFSRDLHERYARDYFDGERPDDDVERAGRWLFLRFSQFASKYNGISGFKVSSKTNCASAFASTVDALDWFADRFRSVTVENRDYAEVIDTYDDPRTLFYLDPPYVDEGDAIYTGPAFDHARFVDVLGEIEGYWVVSYTDLPDGLRECSSTLVERNEAQRMNQQRRERNSTQRIERLAMNFDPDEVPEFSGAAQAQLGFGFGEEVRSDGGGD